MLVHNHGYANVLTIYKETDIVDIASVLAWVVGYGKATYSQA